ncbi:ACT domain-containing protein [Oscillospiraceae bacterium HV4-5-C5C]|nr:ACT domain-containing protein [Oscillospiraceae bacterium HV4-5-C5C]
MSIESITHDFSICKVENITEIDLEDEFCFLSKTDEEISLVCLTEHVPNHILERDDGWKAFRIHGVLDFSLVGVLAKLSALLADNSIGIFAISTYNTDYILTKSDNYEKALDVLKKAGYQINERSK